MTYINHLHVVGFFCLLSVLAVQDCSSVGLFRQPNEKLSARADRPVLVELDADDDNLGGMDTDGHRCTIRFVALYTVDVDDPFLAIHLCDLSFPALVLPAHNSNFVVLADRQ